MNLLTERIGCRRRFAVEFEVEPDRTRPANEWWGSIWLWANGRCIGETHEVEMVSIALDALTYAARSVKSRASSLVAPLSSEEALNAVMLAVYGQEDHQQHDTPVSGEDLVGLEVLPRSAGPFFDHWEAILVEEGAEERFIHRRVGSQIFEARWKINTFRNTVLEAELQFHNASKRWLG